MGRLTRRGHLARQLFLVIVGAFVLLPVWVLILMATDGSIIGYPSGFHPFPVEPTLDRFSDAFFRPGAVLDYWGLLRNSLILSGGARPTDAQCEALIHIAIETCERYFPSLQFVIWAGKSAEEALEASLLDTMGEA